MFNSSVAVEGDGEAGASDARLLLPNTSEQDEDRTAAGPPFTVRPALPFASVRFIKEPFSAPIEGEPFFPFSEVN